MINQDSCGDCGYHHDPLDCRDRYDRKLLLRRKLRDIQDELDDLGRYEKARSSGTVEFDVNGYTGGSHRTVVKVR